MLPTLADAMARLREYRNLRAPLRPPLKPEPSRRQCWLEDAAPAAPQRRRCGLLGRGAFFDAVDRPRAHAADLPYRGAAPRAAFPAFLEIGTAGRRYGTRVFLQTALHCTVPGLVIGAELAYVLTTRLGTRPLGNSPARTHSQREDGEPRDGCAVPQRLRDNDAPSSHHCLDA